MSIIKIILIVIYLIICLALVLLATLQSKEDAGFSSTITGSSSSNFYEQNKGRTKEGKMKKWTVIFTIGLAVFGIALSVIYVV